MTISMTLYRDARDSTAETYEGVRWVLSELISPYAKIRAAIALLFLFGSILCLTAIPFVMKYVIDAKAVGDITMALWYLNGILVIGVLATIFGSSHDHFREKAWNRNFFTIHVNLVHKLFRRTLNEIIGENSEVGAEQIESLKDRAQNIMYLLFFESPVVLVTIVTSTGFIFLIDASVGVAMCGLTAFNIAWFFFFNTYLDDKMGPIDEKFRRAGRRMIEKINMPSSIKTTGTELKIERQIGNEIAEPLAEDLKVWAYWFQLVDFWRRLVNTIVPYVVLYFGITSTNWSLGELAAISGWVWAISREYGFIGHLMRHLTHQISRIKATRLALSKEPNFTIDTGIIYERRA